MNKFFTCANVVVLLALGLYSTNSLAGPIIYEFTGVVTDNRAGNYDISLGQELNGRIVFSDTLTDSDPSASSDSFAVDRGDSVDQRLAGGFRFEITVPDSSRFFGDYSLAFSPGLEGSLVFSDGTSMDSIAYRAEADGSLISLMLQDSTGQAFGIGADNLTGSVTDAIDFLDGLLLDDYLATGSTSTVADFPIIDGFSFEITSFGRVMNDVPEPGQFALFSASLLVLAIRRRRKGLPQSLNNLIGEARQPDLTPS